MKIKETTLNDAKIFYPKIFQDDRGSFHESFHSQRYEEGVQEFSFLQDNISVSKKGVLRGLHFQRNKPQGKLVQVIKGKVYDVIVDLRRDSSTFCMHEGFYLDDEMKNQLWVPPGFAHGFISLSEKTIFHYKCTNYYDPKDEGGIIWNDTQLNIKWPIAKPIISDKDKKNVSLETYIDSLE